MLWRGQPFKGKPHFQAPFLYTIHFFGDAFWEKPAFLEKTHDANLEQMGGKATFPLGRQHHSMDGLQGHKTISVSSERCKNSLWTKAVEEENHEFKYTCKPLPPHWLPHLSSWAWQTYGVCPSSQLRSWSHCSWGMEISQSTLFRFSPAIDQMLSAWQPMDCWKYVCWSTLCLCVCVKSWEHDIYVRIQSGDSFKIRHIYITSFSERNITHGIDMLPLKIATASKKLELISWKN